MPIDGTQAPINDTEIHYEVRGSGAPVLFIPGAFGDAGGWETVSGLLADEYALISYDRRGNSRSPRPAGWTATSLAEHADDAAALLETLGMAPARVYGNSLGGAIALTLAVRHPKLVKHLMVHDPFLAALLPDPAAALRPLLEAIGPCLADGDMRGAARAFLARILGARTVALIPAPQLDRMLANAETFFSVEVPNMNDLEFGDVAVPVTVAVGAESPDFLTVGAHQLASLLDLTPVVLPGAHVPQLTHPAELAAVIRETFGTGA